MIKKIIVIFTFLTFSLPLKANFKENIILNLKKTNNLAFYFKQVIEEKTEDGECTIKYPKKIFCTYNDINKKIIVSNGKSLVIKFKKNNQYYLYPLKRTPLEFILDKDYLINEIKKLNGRIIDDKYINFTLKNNDYKINIFFNKDNLILVGWQTEDVYQNLVITFISKVKINQKIKENLFKLPEMNKN